VQNIFSVFSTGLFSSNAHCGPECENNDTRRGISNLNIHHGTKVGQGTWQCGLFAKFIDAEQMSIQDLLSKKFLTPHSTVFITASFYILFLLDIKNTFI